MITITITPNLNLSSNIRLILMKSRNGQSHSFKHEGIVYFIKKNGSFFNIKETNKTMTKNYNFKRNQMIQFFFHKEITKEKNNQAIEFNEDLFIQVNG